MSASDAKSEKPSSPARRYSSTTIKIVFATCMNECAHPDCSSSIVEPRTEYSEAAVIGQIAHIYAASDNGPRGNPDLTEEERNQPHNLILLCPTHHVVVDKQHETYPATMLLDWRSRHERKFHDTLGARLGDIGFEELDAAARSLLSKQPASGGSGLNNIPPADKIAKNGLGNSSQKLLMMGAAHSAELEDLITKSAQLDPSFPDKLRQGFVARYSEFVADGLHGDGLFIAMYEWAAGSKTELARKTAGLCILAHLFIICDVFEK